jgi:hypothetical protein
VRFGAPIPPVEGVEGRAAVDELLRRTKQALDASIEGRP